MPMAYEFVVVGSGAGGGTVAARLAEAGRRVLLLEAGGDPVAAAPDDYSIPAFNAFATENPDMRWDFFVRHYASTAVQQRDPKYRADRDGVLYPRAGALGGCTAHNAMITVCPHNADWDEIAALTGDRSWSSSNMRRYFERMESCGYRPAFYRWLTKLGLNLTRHGWNGWLSTEAALQRAALHDPDLVKIVLEGVIQVLKDRGEQIPVEKWILQGQLDPNDWRLVERNAVGVSCLPLATRNHARNGTREFVLEVAARHPDRLTIEMKALATRVLLDDQNQAFGVEYLKGDRLYRAHAVPSHEPGELRRVFVSREVILSGGAFNTPQLLMLSGIGPAHELRGHGIPVRVDLAGVGTNLQDRYEVGVVNRMKFPHWKVLEGATFSPADPQYAAWSSRRQGVYATNGVVLSVARRSDPERPLPDLFFLALLGNFRGYFPGYSKLLRQGLNYLTWAVLKAHTKNTAGTVTLRSADPRDTPAINFRYFEEGNDESGDDLKDVVTGIRFARRLVAPIGHLIEAEEVPGPDVQSEEELREFVRTQSWGHHASCTCAIGPRNKCGVLTADLRVHGTRGLRVVDASVFPKIPGFFIATAVYMAAEKASEVILAEAARVPERQPAAEAAVATAS